MLQTKNWVEEANKDRTNPYPFNHKILQTGPLCEFESQLSQRELGAVKH